MCRPCVVREGFKDEMQFKLNFEKLVGFWSKRTFREKDKIHTGSMI
jgi:hypothetical protein